MTQRGSGNGILVKSSMALLCVMSEQFAVVFSTLSSCTRVGGVKSSDVEEAEKGDLWTGVFPNFSLFSLRLQAASSLLKSDVSRSTRSSRGDRKLFSELVKTVFIRRMRVNRSDKNGVYR
jgi:hypothetical protein